MWYFGTGHEMENHNQVVISTVICSLFVLLGIGTLAMILSYKVTLSFDDIRVRGIFGSRRMLRADIAGRHLLPTQYVSTLVLVPHDDAQKRLKIPLLLRRDAVFNAWLADLPDLDAQEVAESQNRLAIDPDLGFRSEDRLSQVDRAKRISKPLNVAAFLALLWAMFLPHPYKLLISVLAALPLLTLLLLIRSRGIYQIEERRNDARPSLALALIGPSLGLALRAILDFNLLEWKPILFITLLISVIMTAAIFGSDPGIRRRVVGLVLLFCFCAVYGYGLSVQANSLLDRSPAQIFRTAVVDKHVTEGRSTTYYLHLQPWGPETDVTEVSVSSQLYNSSNRGDTVCIDLHPGALRVPWYLVHRCS
jgi:hypothetical protein